MKMNKLSFGFLGFIAILLASCSAASITQGNYTGTFTSNGYPTYSGSATANITLVNDNVVNVRISSNGNPDVYVDNVGLEKTEILGVVHVSFVGSNSDLILNGDYSQVSGINDFDVQIDSVANTSAYISFSGKK